MSDWKANTLTNEQNYIPEILVYLEAHHCCTTAELADALRADRVQIAGQLQRLRRQGAVDRRCRPDRSWEWFLPELEVAVHCDLDELRELLEGGGALSPESCKSLIRECGRLRNRIVEQRVEIELLKVRR